jgi:arylsulfatase A-like enzyme
MDACIQRLLTRLEELGIANNTIVILTGDHGESLYEHQIWFDHHGLYESTIHVPLIVCAPGRLPQGARVPGYVAHQDMLPTVLDLLGEDALLRDLQLDGRSVLPLVRHERPTNYGELYLTECTWMRKRGWRTPQWKLIEALEPDFHQMPPLELYDLVNDPAETTNLAEREPVVVQHLRERMQRWVDRRVAETGGSDPILEYQIGLEKRIGSIKQAQDLQAKSETAAQASERPATRAARRKKVPAG